jgi:hypothetical protein
MELMKQKLSHLTSIGQGRDESMLNFVKQFRDIKNRCFHLAILESDLTDLALNGLCSSIKEKLEHYEFLTINKLL